MSTISLPSPSSVTTASNAAPTSHGKSNSRAIIAGCVAGGVVLICIIVAIVVPLARKRWRAKAGGDIAENGPPTRTHSGGRSLHRQTASGPESLVPLLVSPPWSASHSRGPSTHDFDDHDLEPDRSRISFHDGPLTISESTFTHGEFIRVPEDDHDAGFQSSAAPATTYLPQPVPAQTHNSRSGTMDSSTTSTSLYSQPSASSQAHRQLAGEPSTQSYAYPSVGDFGEKVTPNGVLANKPFESVPLDAPTPQKVYDAPSNASRSQRGRNKTLHRTRTHIPYSPMSTVLEMPDTSISSTSSFIPAPMPHLVKSTVETDAWRSLSPQPRIPQTKETVTHTPGSLSGLSLLTSAFRSSVHSPTLSRSSFAASTASRYPSIAASSATYVTALQSNEDLNSELGFNRRLGSSFNDSADSKSSLPTSASSRSTSRSPPNEDQNRAKRAHLRDPDAMRVRAEPQESPEKHMRSLQATQRRGTVGSGR